MPDKTELEAFAFLLPLPDCAAESTGCLNAEKAVQRRHIASGIGIDDKLVGPCRTRKKSLFVEMFINAANTFKCLCR